MVAVEAFNAVVIEANDRVAAVLRTALGGGPDRAPKLGEDRDAWAAFVRGKTGGPAPRESRPKPVVVPLAYVPAFVTVGRVNPG